METSQERPEPDAREIAVEVSITALQAIREINQLIPRLGPNDAILRDTLEHLKAVLFDSVKTLSEVRAK